MLIHEKDLIFRMESEVTSADSDMEGRIRPGALINLLIQSAIRSAEKLGFGFEMLKEQNLFWVLTRLHVEIVRPLRWNENVITETWPKGINGLLYLRDFLVKDDHGIVVARSSSGWLAIDRISKRPGKVVTREPEKFYLLEGKHDIEQLPEKLDPVTGGTSRNIATAYSDFDINRHVTTVRYVDWMMDSFTPDFHREKYPHRIRINFLKEILPGEEIILKSVMQGASCQFEGIKPGEKVVSAYRGRIDFN